MARHKVSDFVRASAIAHRVFEKLANAITDAGGTDEDVRRIETEKGLAGKLAKLIMRGVTKLGTIFSITVGGDVTTEEVLARTAHTYVNPNVTSANFPLPKKPEAQRTLEVVKGSDFDHEPTSEEVIAEAKRRGLTRPTHEDALRWDEQHPNEQGWYVFLHEPWQDPGGDPSVLYLLRVGAIREVDLRWFDGRWNRSDVFVFVRES